MRYLLSYHCWLVVAGVLWLDWSTSTVVVHLQQQRYNNRRSSDSTSPLPHCLMPCWLVASCRLADDTQPNCPSVTHVCPMKVNKYKEMPLCGDPLLGSFSRCYTNSLDCLWIAAILYMKFRITGRLDPERTDCPSSSLC